MSLFAAATAATAAELGRDDVVKNLSTKQSKQKSSESVGSALLGI